MAKKTRTVADTAEFEALELPRVGDVWHICAVTTTGHKWYEPHRPRSEQESATGIWHIILRGINQQDI